MAQITGNDLDNFLDAVALGFGGDDNTIVGGRGRDTLIGGSGNDKLIGGPDQDFMEGGDGNDIYFVDGDERLFDINENANKGFDSVISPVSWTLRANFEKLVLTGSSNIEGTGNQEDNTIIGNIGNNILRGLKGDDFLQGLAGDDRLEAASGDDNLNGGLGNDTLVGGAGNDRYFVDSVNDVIIEGAGAGGGMDLVFASVDDYTLSANVENLFLSPGVIGGTGSNDDNYIQGNGEGNTLNGEGGNDFLNGRDGDDILNGGDGNDRLDGGRGSNTLNGGDGDDQYFVRNGDVINENTGEGTDTVNSLLVDYDLPSSEEVENLVLVEVDPLNPLDPPVAVTGTGNGLANKITGNSLGNILNGGGGNDTLDGEAGIDTLNGGNENDILNGGEDNDTLNGGEGNDTLNGDVGDDLLNGDEGDDKLSGGEGVDTLNGGTGNDSLLGNADNDISNGGEGNDFLEGGDGEDELTGGAGRDRLFGNAGNDTLIGDFGFLGEVDVMWGGAGADTFVLGDGTNIFYDDGDQNTIGNTDYAYIRDFSIVEGDQLQLTGAESDYIFRANSSGATQVLLNEPVSELIAIITGVLPANVIGATIFV